MYIYFIYIIFILLITNDFTIKFQKELSKISKISSVPSDNLARTTCSEDFIANTVEKYTTGLQNDLIETKRIVNQLKSIKKDSDLSKNTEEECFVRPDYASSSLGKKTYDIIILIL